MLPGYPAPRGAIPWGVPARNWSWPFPGELAAIWAESCYEPASPNREAASLLHGPA